MNTIRMSSLPALAQCPARRRETAGMPNVSGEPAVAGTIAHAIIAGYVEGKPADVAGLATVYGVDPAVVEDLAERFAWLRAEHKMGLMVEAEIEVSIAGLLLVGHLDVAIRCADVVDIYDFKTGRVEVDPPARNLQLIAYAVGYMEAHSEVRWIHVHIYQPHGRGHEQETFGRVTLAMWRERIAAIVAAARAESPEYRTGAHCQYCGARAKCPALNVELSTVLTGADVAAQFAALPPHRQSHTLALAMAGKKVCEDVIESAKAVARVNGPIPIGDGTEWGPKIEEQRRIDVARAWPVAVEKCGPHLPEAVKLSLSGLEEAAVANAVPGEKRGWKGAVKRDLIEALNAAGALSTVEIEKFTARKAGGKEGIE